MCGNYLRTFQVLMENDLRSNAKLQKVSEYEIYVRC
jgi:hypothetical protein